MLIARHSIPSKPSLLQNFTPMSASSSDNPHSRLERDQHSIAASVVHILKYERTSDENPFADESKSGSSCGIAELQWLQVDIHDGVDPCELADGALDLQDNGSSPELLEECFGVDWPAVMNEEYDPRLSSFYDNLRNLGTKPVEVFASSPPLLQSPVSGFPVEHESYSAISTPSQHRKRPSSPGSSTTNKKYCQHSNITPTKSTPISSIHPSLSQYSSPTLPQPRAPAARLEMLQQKLEEANPSTDTSDFTYDPSSTSLLPLSESHSSYYDKPESDVVPTARGFLYLMRTVLRQSLDGRKDMEINVR